MLAWLGLGSAAMLVASAAAMPFLLARLPTDHYAQARDGESPTAHTGKIGPALSLAWSIVRTPLGVVLVLAGVIMLVLPGQGLLTILAGLAVARFPGKRRFERWLIQRPPVLRTVNWLRGRHGQPPLEF